MDRVAVLQLGPPLRVLMDWRSYWDDQRLIVAEQCRHRWAEIEYTLSKENYTVMHCGRSFLFSGLGCRSLAFGEAGQVLLCRAGFGEGLNRASANTVTSVGHRSAGCLQLLFILHPFPSAQVLYKYESLQSSPF